jgi:hypothetical protein
VTQPTSPSLARRLFLGLFEAVIAAILLIDAIARPVYRPLLAWILDSRFMRRLALFVAPLPRPVILVLFAVPFAIAEPLKVFALLLIARGRVVAGVLLLVFAYLMTFLIVERIYHAGRNKLLTYVWFKWAMDHIVAVRDALLRVRAALVARARAWLGWHSAD